MLNIHCMPLGLYQTNCYIVHRENDPHCIVIDPGYEAGTIEDYLRDNGLILDAITLTHGHFDHVGAVRQLAADTDCEVYLSLADLSMPPQLTAGPLYYTKTYEEGRQLQIAGIPILVIPTPGHTPGSVCLMMEDNLFSGDTLFAGSCGRTDLPGGSCSQIMASLRELSELREDLKVYPGHGESTTLADEKRYNPYMK